MPKESSGGSVETEVREVAVKPTGSASPRAVITATPAACRRKTDRSRSAVASGDAVRPGVAVMGEVLLRCASLRGAGSEALWAG